jgi:ribosomal protein S18 acetylase RimI-like enzyme
VTIRPCRRDEVEDVLELWRAAGAHPSPTDDGESLGALLEHDDASLLVAEVDGRVVGALIAAWDGWRGNMYRLAVAPAHRHQHIASALVRDGERRLREHGGRRVTALVGSEDRAAVELWESAGYSYDERVDRYVRMIG